MTLDRGAAVLDATGVKGGTAWRPRASWTARRAKRPAQADLTSATLTPWR